MRRAIANVLARGFQAIGYDATISDRRRRDLPYARLAKKSEDAYIGTADRDTLRARCFDLRRNNAIVAGIVERFADNVVGPGIYPQAKTSDAAWNQAAEEYWREWCKVCDVRQRVDMREMQRLSVQMRLLAGEMVFVLTDGGQLQPIEPDRIRTPGKLDTDKRKGVVDGFRVNQATGIVTGAYILPRDGNGSVDEAGDYQFVPRENMLHMSRPFRFDQVRGIPDFAPVINALVDWQELNASTLNSAKKQAMTSHVVKKDGGVGSIGARLGDQSIGDVKFEKFEDGQNYYLKPGEDVIPLGVTQPGSSFLSYSEMLLRIIGAALGLPYEFLLLDFSKGSYSSSRAALLQTYRTFTSWQEWMDRAMQRTWNWRIAKAIKAKELPPAPLDSRGISEWYRVQWSHPEWEWVDPQNQQQSDLMAFQLGAKSHSEITRKRGRDTEDVLREKARDMQTAARLEAEYNLPPGSLINAQIPGQVQPTQQQQPQPAQQGADDGTP
jgi:lambda family phage portal protein